MGNGGGECIGGVIWLWLFLEAEVEAHHFLHLGFAGGAVAGKRFLDFVWGVFVDFEVILLGDKKDDAAGLGDHDAGGNVFAKEELFYGDDVWLGGV